MSKRKFSVEPEPVLWKDRKRILGMPITFTRYSITDSKIILSKGFFNTVDDEILLYRVLDLKLVSTLGNKIFGVGTLILNTADKTHPIFMITNVKDARAVKDMLSKLVEEARSHLGIRGKELYGVADTEAGDFV